MNKPKPDLLLLREALEASWDEKTSYLAVKEVSNPSLGQCYPTSRVIQHFFPKTEIIQGKVWTGSKLETHFWNSLEVNQTLYHIDLTWQQFPPNSIIKNFQILDRKKLNDSEKTVQRCELLLRKVTKYLSNHS